MRATRQLLVLTAAIAISDSRANAGLVTHPDQLCSPAANPCIIDRPVEVRFEDVLDFGTRVVRIEGDGHLTGTLNLLSGGFETDVDGNWMDVAPQEAYQRVEIVARRACSGDPAIPCFVNSQCRAVDAGTCSAGDGRIRLGGKFSGVSPIVRLQGVSDVVIRGAMRTAGNASVPDANSFNISSTDGDVRLNARIEASAGIDASTGKRGRAGGIFVFARGDIFVNRRIRAIGQWGGVYLSPDRDVTVRAPLLLHGGRNGPAPGGFFTVEGRGNFILERRAGTRAIRIDLNGGSHRTDDGVAGGTGGHGEIMVNDAVHLDPKAWLTADGWFDDDTEGGGPGGGTWRINAMAGVTSVADRIHARGFGAGSTGGSVQLDAPGVNVLSTASILITGNSGGSFSAHSDSMGPLAFDGLVDVRGSEDATGRGGEVLLSGRGEITVDQGRILNGGGSQGGRLTIEACTLELGPFAHIDGSYFAQADSLGRHDFRIHGSMAAAPGSLVRGRPGSTNEIVYRLDAYPLLGTITPTAVLVHDPGMFPCTN